MDAANTGLTGYSAYQLGKQVLPKVAPPVASVAAKVTPWAARAALPLYGAYSVADGALMTPYRLATGQESLQGMQAAGVQNSYGSNILSNLARPGRAAWGMVDATQDSMRTAVREYMRGGQLDAARRPVPPPTPPGQDMTGGSDF